jgi:hypothetical protein
MTLASGVAGTSDLASPGTPGNSAAGPQGQQSAQDQQAQQQAEARQNEGDELLQSGNVPGVPGQIPCVSYANAQEPSSRRSFR